MAEAGTDILSRLEAVAAADPDRVAVDCGTAGTLTYGELHHRSNAVADRLRAAGIRPGSVVGVCLRRTPTMVAALAGVWKAGAAYLPLDGEYPRARLELMLENAGAALTVMERAMPGNLPAEQPSIDVHDIARGTIETTPTTGVPYDVPADPGALAYVIYTSGSTGQPKGVEVTHGAVLNLIDHFRSTLGLSRADRVLALTTLSFDIAVLEIWLPLAVGATVVLVDRATARDGRALAETIARRGVTFVQATPSTWRLLVEAGWRSGHGITAVSGGEPLSRPLADALLSTGVDLWNAYGPTETTVWSTLAHVRSSGPVLIGRPIANTTVRLLDEAGREVPAGEVGEICIGGAGLARGYRNRAALTAEKFITWTEGSGLGERLYRTGDLARAHAHGELECLGRVDDQIKIDGHRIEPGEVEAAIAGTAGVQQAIVTGVERVAGETRLVAYLVPRNGGLLDLPRLRLQLREILPRHMRPSVFVTIHEVPLTPNGKVDRRALPAPDWSRADATDPIPPVSETEAALVRLWCEVLDLSDVGTRDNFFDLGGRSRVGARLFARIEETLGVRLPLATLFEAPTIVELAERVETHGTQPDTWACLVPVRTAGFLPPFFCVHPIGGNVVSLGPLAQRLGSSIPFYGIQSAGLDGMRQPSRSIEEMAATYVGEVVRLHPNGPYHLGGASFGGLVAYEMAVQLRRAGRQVGVVALLDTEFPPCPANALSRWLAESTLFRRRLYPWLVRARAHAGSLWRLGPRAYARAVRNPRAVSRGGSGRRDPYMRILAAVEGANRRALTGYLPRRYDGAVTYFRAAGEQPPADRRPLWRTLAPCVEVVEVPGTHFSFRREPHVAMLAEELRARIVNAHTTAAL